MIERTKTDQLTHRRIGKTKARVLAVCFGLLLAVGLAECLLRLFGFSFPTFYQTDSITGMRAIPGSRGWFTLEGRGYVQFNAEGWRDEEHPFNKPAGQLRIAVLGDSFTEAKHVDNENTFPHIVEQTLRKSDGKDVEVLNFGVAGFGTAQQFLALKHHVLRYDPDVVLLAFYSGNDVTDNHRQLKKTNYVPYYVFQDGALVLDDRFLSSAEFKKRSSTLARLFTFASTYSRLLQFVNRTRYQRRVARMHGTNDVQEAGLSDAILAPPKHEPYIEAWAVTEGLLAKMQHFCDDHGIEFCIATIGNSIQVHPDAALRARAMEKLRVLDLFYPDRRLENWGRQHGVRVLNLAAPMVEAAEEKRIFFHGFGAEQGRGHWNREGHRFAAQLIADWLMESNDALPHDP